MKKDRNPVSFGLIAAEWAVPASANDHEISYITYALSLDTTNSRSSVQRCVAVDKKRKKDATPPISTTPASADNEMDFHTYALLIEITNNGSQLRRWH